MGSERQIAPDAGIEVKSQLRYTAHTAVSRQLATQKARRFVQDLYRLFRLFTRVAAHYGAINPGVPEVATHVYAGDTDHTDPGIAHFVLDQGGQLTLQKIRYALGSGIFFCHRYRSLGRRLQGAGDLLDFVYLDKVARLHISVVLHPDTTFSAHTNFLDIVLEASE